MNYKKILLTSLILICFSINLYAQEIYEIYNSVRMLGMGDNGSTLADDENCHFYNPAGIAERKAIKGASINLFSPAFGLDMNLYRSARQILSSGMSGMVNFIQENPGNHYHMRANIFPNISIRNLSFGVLIQSNVDAENSGELSTIIPTEYTFALNTTHDVIPTLTVGFPIYGGILRLGASTKLIWRTEYNENLPYSQMANLSFADTLNEGMGFAFDAGALVTFPVKYFPKFSVVVKNITGTSFWKTRVFTANPPSAPHDIAQTIDIGYGMYFFISDQVRMRWGTDYRDLLNANNSAWFKKIHSGIEFDFGKSTEKPFLQVRAGINQFLWTAGVSINSSFNSFEFATYGEELTNSFYGRSDRRLVFRYVIGM